MANKLKFSNGHLMEEIQKFHCLHNKYSNEFKDRNKKDNAWKEVASRFEDFNPSEATKRFKNIRSFYTRFLKEKEEDIVWLRERCCPKQVENLVVVNLY